jgi:hypothetical protein
MKLTTELKKKIDDYFDNITPEELLSKLEDYQKWKFEDFDNFINNEIEWIIEESQVTGICSCLNITMVCNHYKNINDNKQFIINSINDLIIEYITIPDRV